MGLLLLLAALLSLLPGAVAGKNCIKKKGACTKILSSKGCCKGLTCHGDGSDSSKWTCKKCASLKDRCKSSSGKKLLVPRAVQAGVAEGVQPFSYSDCCNAKKDKAKCALSKKTFSGECVKCKGKNKRYEHCNLIVSLIEHHTKLCTFTPPDARRTRTAAPISAPRESARRPRKRSLLLSHRLQTRL